MRQDTRTLRIGVLGCADIAWRNALPAMERLPEVQVVALASRDGAKAARFAERFGGEPVEGYEKLLHRPDIDAVYLPLPAGLHHRWALRALEAGKHVLVEKPLATSLAEATELVAAARQRGLWIAENFTFVHHAQHAKVRDLIAHGTIGEPRVFSAAFGIPPRDAADIRYRADLGGGALFDTGAYPVRAAQLVLGAELTVQGAVLRVDGARGIDLSGGALLSSAAGACAELTFGFESSYRSTYSVWGSAGRVTLERAFAVPAGFRPTLLLERQDHAERITLPADDQFAGGIAAFAAGVRDGSGFESNARTLLRQAELVEQINVRARRVRVH